MIVPNKIEPLAAESWYCLENLPEISDFPQLQYFRSLARESKEIPFGLGRAVVIKHHLLAYAWARASLLAPDRYPDHLNQFLGFLSVILEAKPIGLKGRTDQQKTEILIIH
ncbi:MAG: hypothetical protein F6K16_28335 [Symploca sp. SIO2B6]|nr:hypothetical protein [Symploca sp. SIO2B6]